MFKWLVAWKGSLPRPKFTYENLTPSPTLSYIITKKPKKVPLNCKSLRFLKFLRVFIDRVVLTFHCDRILFRFLFDSIFFRALSDRGFFESLVIGSSSGSAVTDSSLGSSVHFFRHDANFLSNRATTLFYQKQMFCFTFHHQNEFCI